jgi:hypothetical protein
MNQTLDLVASFLIGGILLLALLGLNIQFNSKYQEIKLSEIAHTNSSNIGQVIEHDFSKIGYGNLIDSSIVSITNSSIIFKGDLNNNGTIERVDYRLVTNSSGKFLKRTVNFDETKAWMQPIERFELYGISSNYDTTYNPNNIKSILVNVEFSKKDYKLDTLSIGLQWRRKFSPKNLN